MPCLIPPWCSSSKCNSRPSPPVAEIRQGDLHGRVDHANLGVSLHEQGNCAFQQGQWPAAAGWFEQALEEKRQGDIFSRVDQSSVDVSEKSLALCPKKMGLA